MSEADTETSAFGVLAGLTFSASILVFSFRSSIPFADLYLTLTLITTVFFVFATVLASDAAGRTRLGQNSEAQRILRRVAYIGFFGFIMLLSNIICIAFLAGLLPGIVVTLAIALVFLLSITW
jgi:hypothetical protein